MQPKVVAGQAQDSVVMQQPKVIRRVKRDAHGNVVFLVPRVEQSRRLRSSAPALRSSSTQADDRLTGEGAEHLADLARLIGCARQVVALLSSNDDNRALQREKKCEKTKSQEASLPRSPLLRLLDQGKPVPGVGRERGGGCSPRNRTRAAKRGGG